MTCPHCGSYTTVCFGPAPTECFNCHKDYSAPVSLQDFYKALESHDWFYDYSDDGSVYRRGRAEEDRIGKATATSPAHKALYDAFRAYIYDKKEKPTPPL